MALALNEVVIPEESGTEKVTFTPEQQAALDKILSSRLAEKERQHQEEIENVRRQARLQVSAASGGGNSDDRADLFLKNQAQRSKADDIERQRLSRYFGGGSSGELAHQLYKDDPALYRALKAKAERLGLLDAPKRPNYGGPKFFPNG